MVNGAVFLQELAREGNWWMVFAGTLAWLCLTIYMFWGLWRARKAGRWPYENIKRRTRKDF
jgi:hypothetical protein